MIARRGRSRGRTGRIACATPALTIAVTSAPQASDAGPYPSQASMIAAIFPASALPALTQNRPLKSMSRTSSAAETMAKGTSR